MSFDVEKYYIPRFAGEEEEEDRAHAWVTGHTAEFCGVYLFAALVLPGR